MKKLNTGTIILIVIMYLMKAIVAQTGFISTNATPTVGNASGFAVDGNNDKWITSSVSGLYKLAGSVYINYSTSNSGIGSNQLLDVEAGNANDLWIASNNGLVKYDGSSFFLYNTVNSGLLNDTINELKFFQNKVYCGTMKGLCVFDGSMWTNYTTTNSLIVSDHVTAVHVINQNDIWIGTNNGISHFVSGNWINYTGSILGANLSVKDILSDTHGTVYVATSKLIAFENGNWSDVRGWFSTCDFPFSLGSKFGEMVRTPSGGVLLFIAGNDRRFVELFYNHTYNMYYVYNNPLVLNQNALIFFAPDANSNLVWAVYGGGLFSINLALYNGTGLGPTQHNVKFLDINKVKARISNNNGLFSQNIGNGCNYGYRVPKFKGASQSDSTNGFLTGSLWVGGLDQGGQIHVAGQTYSGYGQDFWPGPLNTNTGACMSPCVGRNYDYIWKLNRVDIEDFKYFYSTGAVQNGTYIPVTDLLSWPGNGNVACQESGQLAPFYDVNGDGMYDPLGSGDYPIIKGDQMLYWIMNDACGPHETSGGLPLGVEVHCSAYAYNCDTLSEGNDISNYTTFYNYRIVNRSTNNYTNAYIGFFSEALNSLGEKSRIGTNVSDGYLYNFNDSASSLFPAEDNSVFSIPQLIGPLADLNDGLNNNRDSIYSGGIMYEQMDEAGETCLFNKTMTFDYTNTIFGTSNANPTNYFQFYNAMKGIFNDNTHLQYGGDGHQTGGVNCDYVFPGNSDPNGFGTGGFL